MSKETRKFGQAFRRQARRAIGNSVNMINPKPKWMPKFLYRYLIFLIIKTH